METIANLFKDVPWIYIGLGIGTVFFGLVCIVLLCKIIGLFKEKPQKSETKADTILAETETKAERQQIIAAVVAALAEDMGKDANAFRVVSFKKI